MPVNMARRSSEDNSPSPSASYFLRASSQRLRRSALPPLEPSATTVSAPVTSVMLTAALPSVAPPRGGVATLIGLRTTGRRPDRPLARAALAALRSAPVSLPSLSLSYRASSVLRMPRRYASASAQLSLPLESLS